MKIQALTENIQNQFPTHPYAKYKYNIQDLIQYFKTYKPLLKEYEQITQLRKTLETLER